MVLDGRYEILATLKSRAGALFHALDRESGRPVLIRFLAPGDLPPAMATAGLLRVNDVPAAMITEDSPSWRDWDPAPVLPAAGEFTSLFDQIVPAAAPRRAPAPPPVPTPPAPPAPPPVSSEPGDFTRFFQQPMAANPHALPASFPTAGMEAPSGKPFSEPGEFTRFFVGTGAPSSPPAASGEATGIFGAAAPANLPAQGSPESSEYSRFLRPAAAQGPERPTPPPAPAPSPASTLPAWLTVLLAAAAVGLIILVIVKLAR